MKIETKYNVGDLLTSKFEKEFNISTHKDSGMICMEVLAIHTENKGVGTYVFYTLNSVHVFFDSNYEGGKIQRTISNFVIGDKNYKLGEDELKPASQQVIDLLRPDYIKKFV